MDGNQSMAPACKRIDWNCRGLDRSKQWNLCLKKIKMDVKEGKYREEERLKAEIVIERKRGNNYPIIHIRNSGAVAAQNMKVQIIHPETGQIIENHFFPGFPSVLNANQEETSAWTYLEGTAASGVYAMIVVTWSDDFSNDRKIEQAVILDH